jgi:hypothetical protein
MKDRRRKRMHPGYLLPYEADTPICAATISMQCVDKTCDDHAHAVLCSATACPPIVLEAPLLAGIHGVYPRQGEKPRHA